MKKLFVLFMICFLLLTFNVSAKSMFAIGNMYGAPSTVIISYDLQHEGIQKQEILNIPSHGTGAYDICVEPENELLFISFRNSNIVEIINAPLLTSRGFAEIGDISNPASIKYYDETNTLYALERNTNKLYDYAWNVQDTAFVYDTYFTELENIVSGQDMAFDDQNMLLYVADSSQKYVHYYSILGMDYSANGLLYSGSIEVAQEPTSLAIDDGKYLYIANNSYGSKILQYDLKSSAVRSYALAEDSYVVKLALDKLTGNLFASLSTTSGMNKILVLNDLLEVLYELEDEEIVHPSGICVPDQDIGYNPFDVQKDDGVFTWISPNKIMRYTISFRNLLNYQLDDVLITDWLPSDQHVSMHNMSSEGVYNQQEHTVTWNIGNLPAGGDEEEVWVEVRVLSGIQTPDTFINYCTIGNDIVTTTKYIQTLVKSATPVTQSYFDPNPFTPAFYGEPGRAHLNFSHDDSPITQVKICDISGEIVIEDKNLSSNEVIWNGKNGAGDFVANGVYFLIVENQAGEKAIIKIAVLR